MSKRLALQVSEAIRFYHHKTVIVLSERTGFYAHVLDFYKYWAPHKKSRLLWCHSLARAAYPQIEEFETEIESKDLTGKVMNSAHFPTKDSIPAHIDCGNNQCVQGGYNVTEILDPLYYAKDRPQTQEKEGHVSCRGYEKMDHGTRSCVMTATYKVKIKYKPLEGKTL
jgi:hypothetical protein